MTESIGQYKSGVGHEAAAARDLVTDPVNLVSDLYVVDNLRQDFQIPSA